MCGRQVGLLKDGFCVFAVIITISCSAQVVGILCFSFLTAFRPLSLLHFPLLHFPPLLSTPDFSTSAFSAPPTTVCNYLHGEAPSYEIDSYSFYTYVFRCSECLCVDGQLLLDGNYSETVIYDDKKAVLSQR